MEKEYFYVIITGIISGAIVFSAQIFSNLGLSFYEMSVLPYFVPVLALLPFIIFNRKYWIKINDLKLWIFYGIICTVLVFAQFGSVLLGIPIALAVLLIYTQPLWTTVISKLFLKEKITRIDWIACLFVLIGIFILINPKFGGIKNYFGIIVALIGGISLAGWVTVGSFASKKRIHPVTIKFAESLFMILFMILIYPFAYYFISDPKVTSFSGDYSLTVLGAIIIFGIVTQVIAHLLFFRGLQKVPAKKAGIILLLEPVSGAILAAIFLKQAITTNIFFGGALIIYANYLTITNKK